MKKNIKKEYEINHVIIRAEERLGIKLTKEGVQKLSAKIRKEESKFIRATSNTCTVHEVEFEGKTLVVVYDKLRKTIKTLWIKKEK